MRKILYGFVCLTAYLSLSGCFWHTHTERIIEQPAPQSTTVVTPQPSTTVTTAH